MNKDYTWSTMSFRAKIFHALIRAKPIDHKGQMETRLNRNMTQFDVLMYGIGAMLGNSIYGVIAVVAHDYTGPSAFLCFLIAGFVAILNGMCYSELAAHIPRAGSAYAYTYALAGEFLAFNVGWLMLLEYSLSACSAAVLAAYNIDIMSNFTISTGIIEHIGELTSSDYSGLLNRYPNFLAVGICIIAMVILSFGNRSTNTVNIIFCFLTLTIIGIATGFMFNKFHADYLTGPDVDGFLPKGIGGLLGGSGIAFNAFIGFDGISVAGEEARNPRRTIPVAIMTAVPVVIFVCVVHAIAFVGYKPWYSINPQLGLAAMFYHPSILWLRILVCIGATLAAGTNVICTTYAIPRIAYSMADDGLLHSWMGWVHPVVKVPLIPLYIFGILTTLLALFFNYGAIVSFLSVGTLISYIIVGCDLIVMRYVKAHLYYHKDNEEAGLLRGPFKRIKFLKNVKPGLLVLVSLFVYVLLSIVFILTTVNTAKDIFMEGHYWILIFIILMLIGLIVCSAIICCHTSYSSARAGSDRFEVPMVPFVPLVAIFFNIALIVNLRALTWARIGAWLFIGYLVYFFYGLWHSKLINLPDAAVNDDNLSDQPLEAKKGSETP